MPAKRIIILNKTSVLDPTYRAALWADVPAANQPAYMNPTLTSANGNASPAEVQALRSGQVAERIVNVNDAGGTFVGASLPTIQTYLEGMWNGFQNEVTANVNYNDAGRFWDNSSVWNASPGIPLFNMKETPEGIPAFWATTPVFPFTLNRFQFVLMNFANPLGQAQVIKARLLIFIPSATVVTGVVSSPWNFQRRQGPTTPPSGTGLFAPAQTDTAVALPAGIGCYSNPQTPPAGGSVQLFSNFTPQPDEVKVSTLDAPTQASLFPFGGQKIYECLPPSRPITVRAGECLEVVQTATAGTGNGQILCVFTVG